MNTAPMPADLLARLRSGSPDAFAEIVRQNAGWVRALAARRLGDGHLADDVTQATFLVLLKKARSLDAGVVLPAWLFRVASYTAANAGRQRDRRTRHERDAAAARLRTQAAGEDADWAELAPVLDALVEKLAPRDREAIVLRFYRNLRLSEVAATQHVSEEAARKRVDRAVAKLRGLAAARRVSLPTAGVLAVQWPAHLGGHAPAGLSAVVTTEALSTSANAATPAARLAAKTARHLWLGPAKIAAAVVASVALIAGGVTLTRREQQPVIATSPATPPTTAPASQPAGVPQPLVGGPNGELLLYGDSVLRYSGDPAAYAAARQAVMNELIDGKTNPDGSVTLPMSQGVFTSKNAAGQVTASRAYLRFTNKAGKTVAIEEVHLPGEPLLILLTDDEHTVFNALNRQIVEQLKQRAEQQRRDAMRTAAKKLQTNVDPILVAARSGDLTTARRLLVAWRGDLDRLNQLTQNDPRANRARLLSLERTAEQLQAALDAGDGKQAAELAERLGGLMGSTSN